MTRRHDDPALLTGSWATDALDDDERREFEMALADFPELRAEADSLAETARALAYAVEPVEPPASLKASLMAAIQTMPQAPAEPAVPARHVAEPSEPVLEAPVAPVASLTSRGGAASAAAHRRWFQRPAALLSAAAAVGVVFLGVGLGAGGAIFGDAGPGPTTSQAASGLDQIYASPDFARKSARVSGGGTATVVWSEQLGKSAVILDGVKAAPKDRTYELWYIGSSESGGTIKSAGLMDDVDGGVRSAVLNGSMSDGATIGITVEPAGGSQQPTTTPIVAVPTTSA